MNLKGRVLVAGVVAAWLAACGGKGSERDNDATTAGNAGSAGASGHANAASGASGVAGSAETGGNAGATTGTAGASGETGGGGANTSGSGGANTSGNGGNGENGGNAGMSGGGSAGAGGAVGSITSVWKSAGCGKGAGVSGKFTIQTAGTKAPDCAAHEKNGNKVCGAWTLERKYKVILPPAYDVKVPHTLLLEAPGCGATEDNLYDLEPNPSVIRVGLAPPDPKIGHGTNPGEGCFDDKEGDDSVDWPFYEALYDKLDADYCFDRNRVFAGGNSSGSWFANELGCKYAGDAKRPVRGVLPNSGGLPTEAQYVPTCTKAGLAGFWVEETGDGTSGFSGYRVAVARAMRNAKCAGNGWDDATKQTFPESAQLQTCQRITGCDPLFPLVVCVLPGTEHGSHDTTIKPGWPAFLSLFNTAPLAP